jgi:dienelactone hydrolase
MPRLFRILLAMIAYGVVSTHCQSGNAETTTVTFQSYTYRDMRQILAREKKGEEVTVSGRLDFPDQAKDFYPTVVVVHGLGGYREANEGYVAAELRRAGFATLTYDSFAARGTTGAALQGSPGYLPIGVADAFAALQFLLGEHRVDANRVAIIGFSYGGEVAHLTAFEILRSALISGTSRFAGHVPFYPGGTFGVEAASHAYTGAPILMLLGGKDDNLPVAKIATYLAYARAAGTPAPIETVIYPNAYHAWTVSDLGAPRFYPNFVSTKTCPLILLGPKQPNLLVDGEVKRFDAATFSKCLTESPGYSMGFDAAIRAQSITEMIRFLKSNVGT